MYAFHTLVEPAIQRFWDGLVGKGSNLANSLTETTKGAIQVAVSAAWGVVYTAEITGLGWTLDANLLRGALQAAVAALFSHSILWKPSGVNVVLNKNLRTSE